MSSLLSRALVAVPGLVLVLGGAYLGGWFLFALAAVAALLALHELYRLGRALRPLVLAGYGGAVAALLGASIGGEVWMLGGFLLTLALAFLFAAVAETRQSTTVAVAATVLGAAWVGLGLGALILIREIPASGRDFVLAVLLTVFVADTFAYVAGRLAGRHKMTPVMSPGKTWEGFVAGAITGVLTAWFWLYEGFFAESWEPFVFGGIVVLAALMGDLFESVVKRDLGVKDSGRLLLGHGGMLDRLDSLLFAGPAAYFALLAMGQV
ncbi:MAG TPA: phosphatidate cytidylyltransferase [Gaiellaceae bacterium]|jgi:phosphatidate cytidylyltransferase|nr:phosphatidate cytidylyltransferase [Gaiellaceae bacterium]